MAHSCVQLGELPEVRYRSKTWIHPDASVRSSEIHGRGLFALRDFAEGEVISVVGGTVMSDREFTTFTTLNECFNALQIGPHLHLVEDPEVTARTEGSLNHHCDSNLWMSDEQSLAARVPIRAGSELTVDYALFTTSPDWTISPCRCGSPACRAEPRGTDWQLPEVQDRYSGHFSPFLNERIMGLASPRAHGEPNGERG